MFLTASPLDITAMLLEARASDGAVAVFVGVVRNENGGRATTQILYEA